MMISEALYLLQSTLQWQAHPCFAITKFSTLFQVVSKGTFLSRAKVRPWSRLYTMNHPTTHTVKKGRFWNSIIPCSTHRLAVLYSFQCSFHAIIITFFQHVLPRHRTAGADLDHFLLVVMDLLLRGMGTHRQLHSLIKYAKRQNSINASLTAKPVSPTL